MTSRQLKLMAELAHICGQLADTEALRLKRRDLYRKLYDEFGMSYSEIGAVAGVGKHAVAKDLARNSA